MNDDQGKKPLASIPLQTFLYMEDYFSVILNLTIE